MAERRHLRERALLAHHRYGNRLGAARNLDRFMSEARALTNLVGNGVATLVVARWTGDLDVACMQAHLDHPTPQETDEPEELHEAVDAHMHVAADRVHS